MIFSWREAEAWMRSMVVTCMGGTDNVAPETLLELDRPAAEGLPVIVDAPARGTICMTGIGARSCQSTMRHNMQQYVIRSLSVPDRRAMFHLCLLCSTSANAVTVCMVEVVHRWNTSLLHWIEGGPRRVGKSERPDSSKLTCAALISAGATRGL